MTNTLSKVAVPALVSAVAMIAFAGIASADYNRDRGGDETDVKNSNKAYVENNVSVKAYTGKNDANGGDGEDGGDGGDATGSRSNGGDGGNGGRGGDGGAVTSGDASAIGTVVNDVNRNTTHIEGCGCPEEQNHFSKWFKKNKSNGTEIDVKNRNRAKVVNDLYVKASTGMNDANGGDGEDGGDGGDAENKNHWKHWFKFFGNNNGAANGGDGGNGGNGANGGTVRSGDAYADGLITNTVNRNVTRINGGNNN